MYICRPKNSHTHTQPLLIIYNTEMLTEKYIGVQVFALLLSTTFVQKIFLSDKHLAVFRSRLSQEGM